MVENRIKINIDTPNIKKEQLTIHTIYLFFHLLNNLLDCCRYLVSWLMLLLLYWYFSAIVLFIQIISNTILLFIFFQRHDAILFCHFIFNIWNLLKTENVADETNIV